MALFGYDILKEEYGGFREPLAVIRVEGESVSDSKSEFIIGDVEVDITSGYEASAAEFSIYNCYDAVKQEFLTDALKKYSSLGSKVVISLGYKAVVKEVFTGFIARVNYIAGTETFPHVSLYCMDVKGAMMAGIGSRQLVSGSYGEAVNEIFQKQPYIALQNKEIIRHLEISRTSDKSAGGKLDRMIEMVGESDYEFVVRAAKKFHYEFFVDCGDVFFRKAKSNGSILMELSLAKGIRSLDIQYDCTGVVGTVIVRGTDIDKGKLIEAKKKNNKLSGRNSVAKQLVSGSQRVYADAAVRSQSEADCRAEYLMDEISYRFGAIECECVGMPELKPGYFVNVNGLGENVSNRFYLTNVIHIFSQESGFMTKIIGKTDGLKENGN